MQECVGQHWPIRVKSPTVFRETVLPPVFGPVTISRANSSPRVRPSMGTTFFLDPDQMDGGPCADVNAAFGVEDRVRLAFIASVASARAGKDKIQIRQPSR